MVTQDLQTTQRGNHTQLTSFGSIEMKSLLNCRLYGTENSTASHFCTASVQPHTPTHSMFSFSCVKCFVSQLQGRTHTGEWKYSERFIPARHTYVRMHMCKGCRDKVHTLPPPTATQALDIKLATPTETHTYHCSPPTQTSSSSERELRPCFRTRMPCTDPPTAPLRE